MAPRDKSDDSDLLDPHLAAITEEYEMLECIGNGHFAKVRKGRHRVTGELVAVKIITKHAASKMKMLKAEVDIMTKLNHPNVVRLHKVVDTETKLYLVMELLTGGELFDRIVARGHYSEADARTLTRTIVSTMGYLHSQLNRSKG
ncbi:kinase-like domain-containing protein [Pavlovales sp. CCMP2436]|nr:kinase-like domain-containing protein [Pavlovales sp. CCMP2436]